MVSEDFQKTLRGAAKEIEACVEDALDQLKEHADRKAMGAVNWGDLHCAVVDLVWHIDISGRDLPVEPVWQVTIEEAAPDCKIPASVEYHLKDAGCPFEVEVICEW